jgi:hypothetical protein
MNAVAIGSLPFPLFIILYGYQPFKVQWLLTKATQKLLKSAEKIKKLSVP